MAILDIPSGISQIIEAINRLIQTCVQTFGARGTVFLLIGVAAFFTAYRVYFEWRKDKKTDTALKEKDRSIQRLAEEARMWRTIFLKEKMGLTDEQVAQLVKLNDFHNAASARKALEGHTTDPANKPSKPRKRRKA